MGGDVLDAVFSGLIFVTVALTALAIGLVTSLRLVSGAARQRAFPMVLLGNVAVVPLVAYGLATWAPLDRSVTTGVVLCAICAGGPMAMKATQIAGADLTWSLTTTVVLLLLNVVTLPLWSVVLLDQAVSIGPRDLVGVLGPAIVVPVLVGYWLRRRLADPGLWFRRLTVASNVALVRAVAAGVAANVDGLIAAASGWLLVTVVAVITAAGVSGWLIGDVTDRRRASTLSTLNRATGVALLIVSRVYPGDTELLAAAVVFGLVHTGAALGLAVGWSRATRRGTPARGADGNR